METRVSAPGLSPAAVRVLAWLVCLAALLALSEATLYLAGRFLLVPMAALYAPQRVAPAQFQNYLEQRDPLLGWTTKFRKGDIDARGSRTNTFFDATHPACLSAYGDSFTYAEEVDAAHAWANLLSGMMGCRVENFGVGGYGSDQAFLRYQANFEDRAARVLLVHQVENILRNVNQYRQLLYPGSGLGFKPAFHYAGQQLTVEPPLRPGSLAELRAIAERPEAHLRHEYFLPGGPSGKRRFAFPYTLNALLAIREFHIWSTIAGKPWYADFYETDHPSQALRITAGMMQLFHEFSAARGQSGIVVLLPNAKELVHRKKTGRWSYQALPRELSRLRVPYIDLGPPLLAAIGEADPCALTKLCSAHFNEAGYELVARALHEALTEQGRPPAETPQALQ
jgi:hypothetical protein